MEGCCTTLPASRFELRRGDPAYPAQLAEIRCAPDVLRGIGDPGALLPGVAIIGARRATPAGLAAARMLAGWAAASGYVVISGGAIGCDQAAHHAALDAGGTTVAVMGCGADVSYPRGARSLLDRIAISGCVVSELEWGTQPRRWQFPERNRIIAGLARVLLVVEAAVPSGTFSTVDHALAAGRTVAAVPGSIFAAEARGPNRLISQGAAVVTEPSELAPLLQAELGPPPRSAVVGVMPHDLSDDPVLRAVRADPMRPDDIAHALSLDIVTVARRLGVLETSGLIARFRDGRYGPC